MMLWKCDRCDCVVEPGTYKNRRPKGWGTVRLQPNGNTEARSWLVCSPCLDSFLRWSITRDTQEGSPHV